MKTGHVHFFWTRLSVSAKSCQCSVLNILRFSSYQSLSFGVMAEPLATGVLGSLMLPRAASTASRPNVLARIARPSSGRPSLAANFFTPVSRQDKGKTKSTSDESFELGHILDCQTWACPPSKHGLWCQNGSMRTVLLREIATPRTVRSGPRTRRNSKSSRSRFKSLSAQKGSGVVYPRGSYSTSSHAVKSEASQAKFDHDDQPIASTSLAAYKSYFYEYRDLLKTQSISAHLTEYTDAFVALEESDAFHTASLPDLLEFAELLAHQIDTLCIDVKSPDAGVVSDWGKRLLSLHSLMRKRFASSTKSTVDNSKLDSLHSRALAFTGDLRRGEHYLLDSVYVDNASTRAFCSAFTSYLLSISAHRATSNALAYAFSQNNPARKRKDVDPLFLFKDPVFAKRLTKVHDIRAAMNYSGKWKHGLQAQMARALVETLNSSHEYATAYEILKNLHSRSIVCPAPLLMDTCRGLHSSGDVEDALKLSQWIPHHAHGAEKLAAEILESAQSPDGVVEVKTRHAIRRIRSRFKPGRYTRELVMDFEARFPQDSDGLRSIKPGVDQYNKLIFAFLKHTAPPEMENVHEAREDMRRQGVAPDLKTFSILVEGYKVLGDSQGIWETIEEMRKAGLKPDAVLYTTLISWYARNTDSTSAAALYRLAIQDGVKADDVMNATLMWAHTRSGSWKEVVAVFQQIKAATPERELDIGIYNVVMKACLLCGAPWQTMSRLFFKLEEQGVRPDGYTYSILIQSAMMSSQFEYAHEIFEELKRREAQTKKSIINVAILTLMMAGYLKGGHTSSARKMLREMRRRGIHPNSITLGEIAKQYGMDSRELQTNVLQNFVKRVNDSSILNWQKVKGARQQPKAHLYLPLVEAHVKNGDAAAAERAYGKFLSVGGKPSIALLHSLLKAYRATNEFDKVLDIWPVIRDLAIEQSVVVYPEGDEKGTGIQTRMAQLQGPLSTFTQAASEAGYHAEVMNAWMELQARGHPFDAGNWNDYILACIRAGLVERAFKVVEQILLPAHNKSRENFLAPMPDVDAPLEDKLFDLQLKHEVPGPRPMTNTDALYRAARINRMKSVNKRNTRLYDFKALHEDFTYPLEALQAAGPTWKDWHPFERVNKALLIVVQQLQDGYPICATQVGEVVLDDVASHDVVQNFGACEVMLATLSEAYPATMKYIDRYREWQQLKLGPREFRKIYIRR